MKKNKKIFLILSILTVILVIILVSVGLVLHISEIIAMQECAQTPGCMYCIPGKTILAYKLYFISFVLLLISIVFLIIYIKRKKI